MIKLLFITSPEENKSPPRQRENILQQGLEIAGVLVFSSLLKLLLFHSDYYPPVNWQDSAMQTDMQIQKKEDESNRLPDQVKLLGNSICPLNHQIIFR